MPGIGPDPIGSSIGRCDAIRSTDHRHRAGEQDCVDARRHIGREWRGTSHQDRPAFIGDFRNPHDFQAASSVGFEDRADEGDRQLATIEKRWRVVAGRDDLGRAMSPTKRSSPTARASSRCNCTMPRSQLGSHCAVTVASAAMITPINNTASSASTSVNPALLDRAAGGFIGRLPCRGAVEPCRHAEFLRSAPAPGAR